MADASCSGSTPLKSLAERGARDRSLQQDRYLQGSSGTAFRSGGSPANGMAAQTYKGFTDDPGFAQIPSVPMPSTIPRNHAPPSMGPFHAQRSPASTANVAGGSLSGGPGTQSWVTDFASFSAHGVTTGPTMHGQADPMITRMPQPMAYQHQTYQGPFVGGHAFAGTFAGAPAPYLGNMATHHIQGTQHPGHGGLTSNTAEAEFDNAMAQWMAINGHDDDGSGMLGDLARELEAGQRTGPPELQATRDINVMAGHNTEATNSRDVAAEKVQERDESLARSHTFSGTEDGNTLPSLSALSLEAPVREAIPADPQRVSDNGGHDSEVSKAARQLLETVRHEDGEKWQNSRFLHLMREFRDGTKSIVDDEIHETEKSRKE